MVQEGSYACSHAYFGVDNLTNQIKKGLCVQPSLRLIARPSWFDSKQIKQSSQFTKTFTFASRSDANSMKHKLFRRTSKHSYQSALSLLSALGITYHLPR
jgi:hypothetical protein